MLALLLLAAFLVTGCSIQVATDTKVNDDGSGTVGIRLAADKELRDTISEAAGSVAGPDSFLGGLGDILSGLGGILGRIGGVFGLPTTVDDVFDSILGQVAGDWQMDRGTDDVGWQYVDLSRPFASTQEYEQIINDGTLSNIVRIEEVSLTQERGLFSTKTVYTTTANASEALSGVESRALGITEQVLGDILVIENRLTLPGTIKEHNADQVQGNTLVWKVGLTGSTQMYAESVLYNWGPIIAIVIVALVIIAAITVALILILRRRRRRRPNPPVQPTTVHPAPAPIAPPTAAAAPAPKPTPTGPDSLPTAAAPTVKPPLEGPPAVEASSAIAGAAAAEPLAETTETEVVELMPVFVMSDEDGAPEVGASETEIPAAQALETGAREAAAEDLETPEAETPAAPPGGPARVVPIPLRPDKAPAKALEASDD